MTKFVEYWLHLDLIDDLPTRIPKILESIACGEEPPDDFELPKHPFFKLENWYRFTKMEHEDSKMTQEMHFHKNSLTLSGSNDGDDYENLIGFIDWMHPYIYPRKPRMFIGFLLSSEESYPSLVIFDRRTYEILDLEKLFNSGGPIILDPEKRRMTRIKKLAELEAIIDEIFGNENNDADIDA